MRAATILISIVFCLAPLGGIVWIFTAGSITTVDGLFMSLILLSLSGVFLLSAILELQDRGFLSFLHRKKPASGKEPADPRPS